MALLAGMKNRIKNAITYHPKQIKVDGVERFGSDYGGFNVYTKELAKHPIIYSFGVGEDCTFDMAMIDKFDAVIYAYDPTPKSIKWVEKQKLPESFHFYPVGLDKVDGKAEFHLPVNDEFVSGSKVMYSGVKEHAIIVEMKSLPTIMKELGHDSIDILKMDIEGTEFEVIPAVLNEIGGVFDQLCAEVHWRFFPDGQETLKNFVQILNKYGYVCIAVEENDEALTFIRQEMI